MSMYVHPMCSSTAWMWYGICFSPRFRNGVSALHPSSLSNMTAHHKHPCSFIPSQTPLALVGANRWLASPYRQLDHHTASGITVPCVVPTATHYAVQPTHYILLVCMPHQQLAGPQEVRQPNVHPLKTSPEKLPLVTRQSMSDL